MMYATNTFLLLAFLALSTFSQDVWAAEKIENDRIIENNGAFVVNDSSKLRLLSSDDGLSTFWIIFISILGTVLVNGLICCICSMCQKHR